MNWNRLGGWLALGFSLPSAFADVVDDLSVPEQQFLRSLRFSGRSMGPGSAVPKEVFLGLPLSDEHQAAMEAEMSNGFPGNSSAFLESRGNFTKALESERLEALERARLLLRAGRVEEARASLTDDVVRNLKSSISPAYLLPRAFRPLEDAAAWDELRAFLKLLDERFDSPQWRAALWAEELDIAWHLDQLPTLLEQNANDPLRLAFFHHRLGNTAERDALLTGILDNAIPARVAELLGLMPNCPAIVDAALRLWNRDDLAALDRKSLFEKLILQPQAANFSEIFRIWLVKDGDALPLADLIWQRWMSGDLDDPQRAVVLAALVRRHPEEPRFRFLLARQLMKSDPAQATELFTALAALPFRALPAKTPWRNSWTGELGQIPGDLRDDLPGLALMGLGILNRQDLIRTAVDGQSGWSQLPTPDQARYLALGKMDFALVKLVLEADFTKPENDGLADLLQSDLVQRLKTRTLPREVVTELAAKFDSIVAGSLEKGAYVVASDARNLLEPLAAADAAICKEPLERLLATSEKRDAGKITILTNQIQSVAAAHPELKPSVPKEAPSGQGQSVDLSKGMMAQSLLALFAPPEIRRIPSPDETFRRPFGNQRQFAGNDQSLPLGLLARWNDTSDFGPQPLEMFGMRGRPNNQYEAAIVSVMRALGAGNPRRLPVEILIANDRLTCGDPVLKAEAQASFQALMDGTSKEARGNEAFRYLTLAAQAPETDDGLLDVVRSIKSLPPAVKKTVVSQLMNFRLQDDGGSRLIYKEFNESSRQRPVRNPEPDEDDIKLREFMNKQLTAAPETIALAKRILDKAVQLESKGTYSNSSYSASQVLLTTGNMDAWAKETREKLRAAGVPPVEILLRLQRVDQRREKNDQTSLYAREILALDPSSAEAAQQLIGSASREGNQELLFACLRALSSDGLYHLGQEGVLDSLKTENAARVLAIIKNLSTNVQVPGNEVIANLHRYFLKADPQLAAEFRGWLVARGKGSDVGRTSIVSELLKVGMKEEAVDIEARAFVIPTEYSGRPFQFPPKADPDSNRQGAVRELNTLKPDLILLTEGKLFGEVVARMEALGGADPIVLATFRLSATPDVATFEREALPQLAKVADKYRRQNILHEWSELFSKQPGITALKLRILQEKSLDTGDRMSDIGNDVNLLQSAADLPGSTKLISELWGNISAIIAGTQDTDQKASHSRRAYDILRAMLVSADDATWNSYWKWRENEPKELGQLNELPFDRAPDGFIDPARIRQIFPRVLKDFDGKLPAEQAESWVLAAISTGDKALIEQIEALIPPDAGAALPLARLGLGDTMGASPIFGAASEASGETLLWWGFVGFSPLDKERGGEDIPRTLFPGLDGKFDLQITAGKQPDEQVILQKLSSVPASGHISIRLTPDQRYLAMVATDPTSGAIRWSKPVDSQSDGGTSISPPDDEMRAKGFEKLPINGPGNLPAWKIRFAGDDRIDLIERPWNGNESVSVGAWVSGNGKLLLRCFDSDGKELETTEQSNLAAWDSPLPIWQFRSLRVPEKLQIPGETVRLVLSTTSYGANDGPHDFAISNARMEIGISKTLLPEGAERITRVPGTASSLVISPDGKQLAIAFNKGKLATLDLATHKVTELSSPQDQRADGRQAASIAWTAAGLRLVQPDGKLYRLDESGSGFELLTDLKGKPDGYDRSSLRISDDAKWLIWRSPRGRLLLSSADGNVSREITNGRITNFGFTDDGLFLTDENNHDLFLKTNDFASGEPAASSEPVVPRPSPAARWKDRIRFNPERRDDSSRSGNSFLSIPASAQNTAFAADGTLYYIDNSGNIVHVTPSPR